MLSVSLMRFLATLILGSSQVGLAQTFVVNTYTTSDQVEATLHKAPDGTFLVLWESTGQDGDGDTVVARKLDSDGMPVGSEIVVNTVTAGDQSHPEATALTDSRYIVVWNAAANTDVRGRFLNSDGTPAGGEIVLSTHDPKAWAAVAPAPLGGFLMAWSGPTRLYSQAFDSTGAPLDDEIVIGNDITQTPGEIYAGINLTALDNGNFLATWESDGTIFLRLLDSDGAPIGDVFNIDNDPSSTERRPIVVAEPGGALILWTEIFFLTNERFYTRRIANDGTFLTEPHFTGLNRHPSSSLLKTPSGFLMTLIDRDTFPDRAYIHGVALTASGQTTGGPFRITDEALMSYGDFRFHQDRYHREKLALTDDGDILVLWSLNPEAWNVTVRRIPPFRLVPPDGDWVCGGGPPVYGEVEVQFAGGTDPVTLSVPGRPDYTFSPNPVLPGGSTTIHGPSEPNYGTLQIFEVHGTDGEYEDTVQGRLNHALYSIGLLLPESETVEAPIAPGLNWRFISSPSPESPADFRVQLASDPFFDNILEEAVVTESYDAINTSPGGMTPKGMAPEKYWRVWEGNYQTKVLEPNTEYFWRVRALGICGGVDGLWFESSFTTAPDPIIAGNWIEMRNSDQRSMTLRGTPDVAPILDPSAPGTFVVSYPSYYQRDDEQGIRGHRSTYAEIIRPKGASVDRFAPISLDGSGAPSEILLEAPAATTKTEGEFFVAWGGSLEVASQRYNADSGAIGSLETLATSSERRTHPSIATNDADEQLVVWADDNGGAHIAGQRIASDGSPIAHDFQVNSGTAGTDRPAIAWNPKSQEFLVVWESDTSSGTDNDNRSIQGRRLASDGTPMATDFQINTITAGDQNHPEVSPIFDQEDFLVVWQSTTSSQDDNSGRSIQSRRITAAGPMGNDFQLNTYTTDDQKDPDIAVDPTWGGILVTWQSQGSWGTDNSSWSVQARRLDPNATPQEAEFQVNEITANLQYGAKVAAHPESKEFMVVWSDTERIFAKRFAAEAFPFADGFESGDTSSWSETLGKQ